VVYDYEVIFRTLTRRYGAIEPEALIRVLCPLHIPILSLDKSVFRITGQNHWRASFTAEINDETRPALSVSTTGKFVPSAHVVGSAPWREIAKGRIVELDFDNGIALGEIYVGTSRSQLDDALEELHDSDFLEVDQFGAAAKVLSALTESTLATLLERQGFEVRRMPEDTARHLGSYANYDFEVDRGGVIAKVEVKSLWGTDTRKARLIHSTGAGYPTSSCKFETQDFFAVSLFLRTGNLNDWAFARSVSIADAPYGLPFVPRYPAHVTQNPSCVIGDGHWFSTLAEAWDLP
jgi:hypothetical protein